MSSSEKWGSKFLDNDLNPINKIVLLFTLQFVGIFLILFAIKPNFVLTKKNNMKIYNVCIYRLVLISLAVSIFTLYFYKIKEKILT